MPGLAAPRLWLTMPREMDISFNIAPLRQRFWRRELADAGKPRQGRGAIDDFAVGRNGDLRQ